MDVELQTYKFYEAHSLPIDIMENKKYQLKEAIIIVSQLTEEEKIEFFLFYDYEYQKMVYSDASNTLYANIEEIIKTFVTEIMNTTIIKELLLLKKINRSDDNIIQFKIKQTSRNFFSEIIHFDKPHVIKKLYNETKNDEMKLRLNLIAKMYNINLS